VRVKATVTVDGEKLESQEFEVAAAGGIRVALVATDPELQKRAAEDSKLAQSAATPGLVVLGDQTRFVIEAGDEALNVFNIIQVVNSARTPVQSPTPVVFELPDAAQAPGMLDGSSPLGVLAGKRVTVNGPFPPGATIVQFAYSIPFGDGDASVSLTLPVALSQVTVMAQKVGEMQMASAQLANHREMAADGQTYIVGQGPALKAGDTLVFAFTGLPHHATWPRNLALALAVMVLAGGVWGALRSSQSVAAADVRRKKLEAKRDRLFAELATLEEQHREHPGDPERHAARRRELVTALERVYADMDEEAAA
jgi:hypothetical protein